MKLSVYQTLASVTARNDKFTNTQLLANWGLGLAGESGELVDAIKKHVFHGHEIDTDYVTKELGDVLWYVAAIANTLDIDLDTVAIKNIDKLSKRYPEGFSEHRSINRYGDNDE